jgi:hypothetical protein
MSDTPETDAFFWRKDIDWNKEVEFCCKMERERNEWKEVAEGSLLGAIHERDESRELAANLEISLTAAITSANARQDETEHAMAERDKAVSSCHIWQDGHSKIVEDRDYWRAEAERWREINK